MSALFIADQGASFQVVDDSGGDRGNDGYDARRGILYAIYCPEKPLNDARALAKARKDLAKAKKLLSDPGYRFGDWVFVTPIPLREGVQATLRAEANAVGLTATFMSAPHLEAIFLQHPELRNSFPELNYPHIEETLKEINGKLDALITGNYDPTVVTPPEGAKSDQEAKRPQSAAADSPSLLYGFSSPRLADLQARLHAGDTGALYELERFKFEAKTGTDWIAAALVEIEFEGEQLNMERVRTLGAEAAKRAVVFGFRAESAVFLGREAHARTVILSGSRLEFNSRLAFSAMSGALLVSMDEATAHDSMCANESSQIDELFRSAHQLASDTKSLAATLQVALFSGMAATQRAFPERLLLGAGLKGVSERIEWLRRQMVAAYSLAISAASALGSQQLSALVYHDFANDLLTFGDKSRALSHANYAMSLAVAGQDNHQIAKTKQLLGLILRTNGAP